LPLEITNTAGCSVASCPHDLGPNCQYPCPPAYLTSLRFTTEFWAGPDQLKGPFDSTGYPVGCKSYCEVDPNPNNSPSCCTGSYSTPNTCPNSTVQYYSYFSASFRLPCIGSLCNTLSRVELPRCICVCIRRIERDCALDLPDVVKCRLYDHLLSLNLARTDVSLSGKKKCSDPGFRSVRTVVVAA
jgi:hypothetical protein